MAAIQIIGMADGSPGPFDYQYVKAYDPAGPNTPGLICRLETTPNLRDALELTTREAVELWRAVDPREPTRPDGQPNRPLTAFTVEIT